MAQKVYSSSLVPAQARPGANLRAPVLPGPAVLRQELEGQPGEEQHHSPLVDLQVPEGDAQSLVDSEFTDNSSSEDNAADNDEDVEAEAWADIQNERDGEARRSRREQAATREAQEPSPRTMKTSSPVHGPTLQKKRTLRSGDLTS